MNQQIENKHIPTAKVALIALRQKWIIIGITITLGVGAYVYTRTLPDYFKATINCVPASNDQSLLGSAASGLGSALKDIGLTKLTGNKGNSYELIVVLFARQIRDSMITRFGLVEEYDMADEPMEKVREEFEDNLEINLRAEGNYEITIWSTSPLRSVEMCKAFVEYANNVANTIHRREAIKNTGYLAARVSVIDSALDALTDSLSYYSKTYMMFSPDDQALASAKALADFRANVMQQQTILGILQNTYGDADPQTRSQATIVRELENKMKDLTTKPGLVGNFTLGDAAGIGARYMRILAEFEAHAKLKGFILPTFEQARLDQQKTTPTLIVVDDPVPMEKKDKPKRAFIALGTGIGGAIIYIVTLLLITAWKNLISRNGI